METNAQNQQKQKSMYMRITLVVLGILLLFALIVMTTSIKKGGRLSTENQDLQNETNVLKEESQLLLTEKNKSLEELSVLKAEINRLEADYSEQLQNRDAQISTLRSRTHQAEQMRKKIEEYKIMEGEFKELQEQYTALLSDKENLENEIEKINGELKVLRDSILISSRLNAYNISPLTKWERWLFADRYYVFRARRVNETAISFEIAGNDFTMPGNRMLYLNMLDPNGSVMYASSERFTIKETGEESPYTQKKKINYSGDNLPMNFIVSHPDRLEPGTYRIKVYIDGELIRTGEIRFE